MKYTQFKDKTLPALGFGAMRLPLIPGGAGTDIDEAAVDAMVDYAFAHGINYFDTAKPYHAGRSEVLLPKSLRRYPRESWMLANKYPGHQVAPGLVYNPEEIFPEQLEICGVDYFDFYLIHNVNEHSEKYYLDDNSGAVEYFVKQREEGKIHHLGFSSHGGVDCLKRYLEKYGKDMEFCMLQINYVDWSIQEAEEKCRLLEEYGVALWLMEPVRGGKLAKLDDKTEAEMKALCPEKSIASWAFRWAQTVAKPVIILSGMSNMEQLVDNINTIEEDKPLNAEELAVLDRALERMGPFISCTKCGACSAVCPQEIDIPLMISLCNDMRVADQLDPVSRFDAVSEHNSAKCIGCGACASVCPMKNDIPKIMKEVIKRREGKKSWIEICHERYAAMHPEK